LQLCAQIAETLAFVFADSADPLLHNLLIVSVVPSPTSARVLVTVAPAVADHFDGQTSLNNLEANRSRLRSEIAATVHRRKVPDLFFRIEQPR
jgi:ribosome-binding factor A